MSKRYAFLCFVLIITLLPFGAAAAPEINAKSSILIEASSGKVLYENNADEKRRHCFICFCILRV